MRHLTDAQALLRHARLASGFRSWLIEDGERLVAAADLLGGPQWAIRAAEVVEAVARGVDPAKHLSDLRDLRRLLWLEAADDLEALEAQYFASIDPDDPRADDARICAEAIDRGVRAISAVVAADGRAGREAA
jgi:hypothetical protein